MARRKKVNIRMKVDPKTDRDGTIDYDFYKPEFKNGQESSVCMDLKAKIDAPKRFMAGQLELHPGQVVAVSTGVYLELPPGWEAEVRPRSGLAKEYGISVVNTPGTIDTGYRGEIIVLLTNLRHLSTSGYGGYMAKSNKPYIIQDGQRIAQLAIREVPEVSVEFVDELSETERGDKGFGSTGIR